MQNTNDDKKKTLDLMKSGFETIKQQTRNTLLPVVIWRNKINNDLLVVFSANPSEDEPFAFCDSEGNIKFMLSDDTFSFLENREKYSEYSEDHIKTIFQWILAFRTDQVQLILNPAEVTCILTRIYAQLIK